MTENPEQPQNEEEKKDESAQTKELQNMLDDLDEDNVPKFKSTPSDNIGKVSEPSFLDADEAPQTAFPGDGKLKILSKPEITPKKITLKITPIAQPEAKFIGSEIQEDENPTGNYWRDSQIFFKQLGRSYEERYLLWNQTYSSIVAILRKMRRINESNTNSLIKSIKDLEIKLISGLEDFAMKRNEVERFSDIDYKLVTKNFKKTMELLSLQMREFKLQQSMNELFEIYAN